LRFSGKPAQAKPSLRGCRGGKKFSNHKKGGHGRFGKKKRKRPKIVTGGKTPRLLGKARGGKGGKEPSEREKAQTVS